LDESGHGLKEGLSWHLHGWTGGGEGGGRERDMNKIQNCHHINKK